MAGTTGVYQIPFPTSPDPADGAGNLQSLASAVDADLAGLFSRTTVNQLLGASNITLQDVTNMSVTVAASSSYWVKAMLFYQSPAVAPIKVGWSAPSGSSLAWTTGALASSVTAASSGVIEKLAYAIGSVPVLGVDGATTLVAMMEGWLGSGVGGTFKLQAAQSVSSASQTTIIAGSVLWLRKTT
jgi:hypothetical protein